MNISLDWKVLKLCTDEEFPSKFYNQLSNIFEYEKQYIIDLLESKNAFTLKPLRYWLLAKAGEKFTELSILTAADRRTNTTISQDIYFLGLCITSNTLHSEVTAPMTEIRH